MQNLRCFIIVKDCLKYAQMCESVPYKLNHFGICADRKASVVDMTTAYWPVLILVNGKILSCLL